MTEADAALWEAILTLVLTYLGIGLCLSAHKCGNTWPKFFKAFSLWKILFWPKYLQ